MSEDNIRYDQVKIACAEDCGNAPKKELLRAFNVAFVCNDVDFITETITEDIQWNFIGSNVLQGKAHVFRMLEKLIDKKPTEFVISNIITHGYSKKRPPGFLKRKRERALCFPSFIASQRPCSCRRA
jgi:hypothetical protein